MPCFPRLALARILFSGLVFAGLVPLAATAQPRAVELASHRAVYDLTLQNKQGSRPLDAIRGRILYDLSGDRCEGFALQFRQVSELDLGEGKTLTSDLRATTWEEGAARSFRFKSENYTNDALSIVIDGKAEREKSSIAVKLTKPQPKEFSLDGAVVFPTEHMIRVAEAAIAGKNILELPVFDGSDDGEKVYDTLTVIGQEIPAGEKNPDDAAGRSDVLSRLKRWPISISYFDRGQKKGEQIPIYSIRLEMYENGVARNLSLDYNDFVIAGKLTSLEINKSGECK